MAFLIDTIDSSGLFAQSANSATIATKDSNGNDITATYQTIGDYYSASNPSGFITEVPDTYLQNTDLNITAGTVTGISGIPISASGSSEISSYDLSAGANINITKDDVNSAIGIEVTGLNVYQPSGDYYSASNPSGFISDLPASATEAIDAVTANSGAWGGSALPISAGPGIKVNLVNNTLVFSSDYNETVLWSGTLASGSTASLSENITAFNKIAFIGYSHNGSNYVANGESNVNGTSIALVGITYWPGEVDFVECRISDTTLTCDGTIVLSPTQGNKFNGYITKVIGINRISGGN